MTAFPYGDVLFGMLEYWHQRPDVIELVPAWSDDLRAWRLPPGRDVFLPAAYSWNAGWNAASSAPPIPVGNRLWFYFNGRGGGHSTDSPHCYGVIALATITRDRFCSLTADARSGRVITKPMTWPGGDLVLNASTTRYPDGHPRYGGGEIRVEILDEARQPVAGYSGEDAADFHGNHPSRRSKLERGAAVRWGERSLDELKGRRIRLRFDLRDAHVYSFCAAPPGQEG